MMLLQLVNLQNFELGLGMELEIDLAVFEIVMGWGSVLGLR